MLALAHHWREMIRGGVVKDQAAVARLVGVSRARVTQVIVLLYLAPDIQEAVLDPLGIVEGGEATHDRDLRGFAADPLGSRQRTRWSALAAGAT